MHGSFCMQKGGADGEDTGNSRGNTRRNTPSGAHWMHVGDPKCERKTAAGYAERERKVAGMNFGEALEALKAGYKCRRAGWNGKGIYIEFQKPDEYSKMTLPYIYIVTTSLITDFESSGLAVVIPV